MDFVTRTISRVPLPLLDQYAHLVWFSITHSSCYPQPLHVFPTTFAMRKLFFYISKSDFHNEVITWPGLMSWQQDEMDLYNFDAMRLVEDTPSSSCKDFRDTPKDVQPLLKKAKECVSSTYATWTEVGSLVEQATRVHQVSPVSTTSPTIAATIPPATTFPSTIIDIDSEQPSLILLFTLMKNSPHPHIQRPTSHLIHQKQPYLTTQIHPLLLMSQKTWKSIPFLLFLLVCLSLPFPRHPPLFFLSLPHLISLLPPLLSSLLSKLLISSKIHNSVIM